MLGGSESWTLAGFIGVAGGLLKITNKFQEHTTRVENLEKRLDELRDDVKYIRNRVDEIGSK